MEREQNVLVLGLQLTSIALPRRRSFLLVGLLVGFLTRYKNIFSFTIISEKENQQIHKFKKPEPAVVWQLQLLQKSIKELLDNQNSWPVIFFELMNQPFMTALPCTNTNCGHWGSWLVHAVWNDHVYIHEEVIAEGAQVEKMLLTMTPFHLGVLISRHAHYLDVRSAIWTIPSK